MDDDGDEDAMRRAILDLARAEANLRQAVLARSIEGVDDVAAAQKALDAARETFEKVAHPKPRVVAGEDVKSWGSH